MTTPIVHVAFQLATENTLDLHKKPDNPYDLLADLADPDAAIVAPSLAHALAKLRNMPAFDVGESEAE